MMETGDVGQGAPPRADDADGKRPAPSTFALFAGFLGVGLMGFGSVLPMSRRMLVDKRRWLTPGEFTELLALCQFLPGGNIINLSVAVGLKFRGAFGAVASLVGLVAAPCVIVAVLGVLYGRLQEDPRIGHLFAGLAAAAAGLLIGTALKIAAPLRRKPASAAMAALCFVAIAVFRQPLLLTMALMVPLSLGATWMARE